MQTPAVRSYAPGDLDALYRVCLLTGDNGGDATHLYADPRLVGDVYAAPYARFEPGLAFVAEDHDGVGGYVLAALDTDAFAATLEEQWWPALRARHPDPRPPAVDWTPDQRMAHLVHHPAHATGRIVADFPSHLHIDLLPRLQRRGVGRRLMATLFDALLARGSTGVHLGVSAKNTNALAFYRHLGFTELHRDEQHLLFGMRLGPT